MIDVGKEIYSDITKLLRKEFPDIYTARFTANVTPKFPAVSIVEENNIPYEKTIDSGTKENHIKVTYSFEIYTNDKSNKQSQAEKIRDIIDNQMMSWGFLRKLCKPIPNLEDMTIYRINMRYEGVISREGYVYVR